MIVILGSIAIVILGVTVVIQYIDRKELGKKNDKLVAIGFALSREGQEARNALKEIAGFTEVFDCQTCIAQKIAEKALKQR